MVISYSAETEFAMVEAYYVILMKIFLPTVNVEGIVNESNFLDNLSLIINRLTCQYENFVLIGDFNMTIENKILEVVMNSFGLECLTKKPTCF